jgi:hypothetical protein
MRWIWTLELGTYVLRPDPLPPGVSEVGFLGRRLLPQAPGPLADRKTVLLGQVHGAHVARCEHAGEIPSCDGARSRVPGLLLTVRTADCIPVLLASPSEGIALLHAGWRGLVAGILEAGAATFSDPRRLHVLFGPAIGPCCYDVGPEVAAQFPSAALPPVRGSRPRLDLFRAAALRLAALGVSSDQGNAAPFCTRCHQHVLHSSRGSGAAPGRIVAFAAA